MFFVERLYIFIVQHCLSPEAKDDYLRQRRAAGTCRTSHLLNIMVAESADLYDRKVDCCSAGCVAFSVGRQNLTECDMCKALRY